jgi:hypothetical protein
MRPARLRSILDAHLDAAPEHTCPAINAITMLITQTIESEALTHAGSNRLHDALRWMERVRAENIALRKGAKT